jgi:hypothetical protein
MRLRGPSASSRAVLLAVSVLLVLSAFALPASASHRTQFIHAKQWFESPRQECASGTFEASGAVTASGNARSCARKFYPPSKVKGTTELHNGDDLSVVWNVQCRDEDGRLRHFECTGQWRVDGPNWVGGGQARLVLDFVAAPYGTADFTFNGNLSPA